MANNNPKTNFAKVAHIGETLLSSELEHSLKMYLDWSFLKIGGFTDVSRPTSGAYGGNRAKLRMVTDPSYTRGQVWESHRKEFVWETGLDYSYSGTDYDPIQISGVYINGTLYNTGDSTYGHYYNYPMGKVVFNNAIPSNSTVELEYSSRDVQTYIAQDAPWWDEIQLNSYRVDDSTINSLGSGNWDILAESKVQLPAIVIEIAPRRSHVPYGIGGTTQMTIQDVNFHILSEDRWWKNQLVDILSEQVDCGMFLLDVDKMMNSGAYPLDYRGMLVDAQYNYQNLSNNYKSYLCDFKQVSLASLPTFSSRLHQATVRATFEITQL